MSAVYVALLLLTNSAHGADPSTVPPPSASSTSNTEPDITAKERSHWAFKPLTRPMPPGVQDIGRVRTPIDAFVLARLETKGLRYSPDADSRTLARRVYLDLLGLPPSPEELHAFLGDTSPDAYERLLDRLLASPQFGVRWARPWLDGAGYVDVTGGDNDAGIIKLSENRWRYRDYVVRALNADKPFERFLMEQIAGDELVDWRGAPSFTPEIRERLEATGFLRGSADDTDEHELNTSDIRHGVLQRTGEILVSNLLGLSLHCAKCHDHKYEPISQRDYYSLLALLQPAFNPDNWLQPTNRQLPDVSPTEKAEMEKQNAAVDQHIAGFQKQLADLRAPHERKLAEKKLAALPEAIRADTRAATETPAEKRTEVQKYLASKFEKELKVKPEEVDALFTEEDKRVVSEAKERITQLTRTRRQWKHLQVVYDVGPPTPTRLLRRGEHTRPGVEVAPAFLRVLCETGATYPSHERVRSEPTPDPSQEGNEAPKSGPLQGGGRGGFKGAMRDKSSGNSLQGAKPLDASSGRRLALARWLTDSSSRAGTLTLRVRVNRVWQQLLGRGLVETSDNFGVTGAAPTHPELLEWLSSEFATHGQQLKPLLKQIMTSTVYRQASSCPERADGLDPRSVDADNQWLWRQRLRRLDSEIVRDSLLAVSGALNPALDGPPVPVEMRPDGSGSIKTNGLAALDEQWRRSLYLLARRNYHLTLLNAFDQPNLAVNCTQRSPSAVVLQPLTMLNDAFVMQQAGFFARRIIAAAEEATPDSLVASVFEIALSRPPAASEAQWCNELLVRHRQHYLEEKQDPELAFRNAVIQLCHTLVNTSEFLYAP